MAGAIVLTIWSGFNLLLAAAILVAIIAFQRNAPAVLFNACAASFCALILVVIWTSLINKARWAYWTVTGSMLFLQAFGFVCDSYLGDRDLLANIVSMAVLLIGLGLSGYSIRR
jgi:hypothetical protein